jgi:UPF0042 nucleotide-binding protein
MVVTGLSGAGKTTALKALEDLGYEAVDHLPLALLGGWLRPICDGSGHGNGDGGVDGSGDAGVSLAIGVDVRTRDFAVERLLGFVNQLRRQPAVEARLVFLTCDDDELLRRYTTTRRRHPLAPDSPIGDGIACERHLLAPLRERADLTIDTTQLNPGELKLILTGHFRVTRERELVIQIVSFSYRTGLPREADVVFDVRFLANPYYEPELRPLTGRNAAVGTYISRDPGFGWFMASLTSLMEPLIPRYAAEGKSYLTIAVGCTGGRHRSVFVAETLAARLQAPKRAIQVYHRDLVRSETTNPVPGNPIGNAR